MRVQILLRGFVHDNLTKSQCENKQGHAVSGSNMEFYARAPRMVLARKQTLYESNQCISFGFRQK